MKLVVGLGNPGEKYKDTRHNLGFLVVDYFARENGFSWRYSPDWICYWIKRADYLVIKPSTFVNKSGEAAHEVANYFKVEVRDILVICDDLDLDFGKIRVSFNGVSAGHRGIESVIESLGTPDFARLRIGIDHPKNVVGDKTKAVEKYVLEPFDEKQQKKLTDILKKCQEAIHSFIDGGIDATMNKFN